MGGPASRMRILREESAAARREAKRQPEVPPRSAKEVSFYTSRLGDDVHTSCHDNVVFGVDVGGGRHGVCCIRGISIAED